MEAESKGERSERGTWQYQVLSGESQWLEKHNYIFVLHHNGENIKGVDKLLDILMSFINTYLVRQRIPPLGWRELSVLSLVVRIGPFLPENFTWRILWRICLI